jgi:hypothetical protein
MMKVQFFKEKDKPATNTTLHSLCWRCYRQHEERAELEHIDAAFDPDTTYALDRLYAEWQQAESVAEHRGWTGETAAAAEAASDVYLAALEAARNGYAYAIVTAIHMRGALTDQDLRDMAASLAEMQDLEMPFGGLK